MTKILSGHWTIKLGRHNGWPQQKLAKFGFRTRTTAIWPMEQSSILSAKFAYPLARQNTVYFMFNRCTWLWNYDSEVCKQIWTKRNLARRAAWYVVRNECGEVFWFVEKKKWMEKKPCQSSSFNWTNNNLFKSCHVVCSCNLLKIRFCTVRCRCIFVLVIWTLLCVVWTPKSPKDLDLNSSNLLQREYMSCVGRIETWPSIHFCRSP